MRLAEHVGIGALEACGFRDTVVVHHELIEADISRPNDGLNIFVIVYLTTGVK